MSIQISKQKIFDSEMRMIAEEALCRELRWRGIDSAWDVRLLNNIGSLAGEVPLHVNLLPSTIPLIFELEEAFSLCRMKERVVFEITESGIMSAAADIRALAGKGYRLALDHFGRGESNYHALLVHFPPSVVGMVKLDLSLPRWGLSSLKSIAETLKRQGYKVYLEGIEDEFLAVMSDSLAHCVDGFQGFGLHIPQPCVFSPGVGR